jgi:hypothetical protein
MVSKKLLSALGLLGLTITGTTLASPCLENIRSLCAIENNPTAFWYEIQSTEATCFAEVNSLSPAIQTDLDSRLTTESRCHLGNGRVPGWALVGYWSCRIQVASDAIQGVERPVDNRLCRSVR